MTNSAGIKRQHVLDLMMEDGFGPDEVIEHAAEYAKVITGTRPSTTAVTRVQQIARAIINEVRAS